MIECGDDWSNQEETLILRIYTFENLSDLEWHLAAQHKQWLCWWGGLDGPVVGFTILSGKSLGISELDIC